MESKNTAKAKPFLKWAGGKGQLLSSFQYYYPEELKQGKIVNYYEPFLGGGAVFLDIIQHYQIKSAFLFDINDELVLSYLVIQKNVEKLIEQIQKLDSAYKKLKEEKQKLFYYNVREKFNYQRSKINHKKYSEAWIQRAAQIIFLNKTCFNGLFRFNSKGEFNVPAGSYKNPTILDTENLIAVAELLSLAEIRKSDFRAVEKEIKPNSFVYFDPPYRPISQTSAFTSYSKSGFFDEDQQDLAALFKQLNRKEIKLMLSNSDPKNADINDNFFDDLYQDFAISRIPAKRMINSNAEKRKAINEIIVTNYLPN